MRALQSVGDDLLRDVRKASTVAPLSSSTATYNAVADRLGAYSESSRGSAICTTVLAVYLAWLTRDTPEQAAVVSTNALGSDTDTVATMTCALLGATVERRPPQDPMDASYIAKEARRLANIRGQASTRETSFTYPDLLQWEAPRTQLDAVQLDPDGNYIVGGLGSVRSKGESHVKSSLQGSAVWQWLELEFGQNLLIKRRQHPRHMKMTKPSVGTGRRGLTRSPSLFEVEKSKTSGAPTAPQRRRGGGSGYISVEEAVRRSVKSDYDPLVVGESLLALADRANGVEWAVAFAAVIATRGKRVPRRLGGMPKAVAHQEPAQRIAEGFSLMTRVIDNRVYVAIKNDGESATFKGQIIRLSNVEDLSVPLPWAIRWKDATGDSLMIDRGQERLLELAQVHAAIRPNGKTGDVDRGAFEVFTPEGGRSNRAPVGAYGSDGQTDRGDPACDDEQPTTVQERYCLTVNITSVPGTCRIDSRLTLRAWRAWLRWQAVGSVLLAARAAKGYERSEVSDVRSREAGLPTPSRQLPRGCLDPLFVFTESRDGRDITRSRLPASPQPPGSASVEGPLGFSDHCQGESCGTIRPIGQEGPAPARVPPSHLPGRVAPVQLFLRKEYVAVVACLPTLPR